MPQIQVNIHTAVNSAGIRREQYNGTEHIVIPSYTLPSNVVMNGGLYPASEIDAHYLKLEGTLAPIGHPVVNGKHVSAFSPEAITNPEVNAGVWNRNVKKQGNRVYSEKWVNVEFASNTAAGKRLLERVAAFERGDADAKPIHTSVALFVEKEDAPGADGYSWIAHIKDVDHDAILLDEPGAATPEDGVGMMVNSASATPLEVNSGVLDGESYGDKQRRLESAVKSKFETTPDNYAWVADFTDSQVIIVRNGGIAEVFGYKIESGKVIFDDSSIPVERRESWILRFNQRLKHFFQSPVVPAKTKEVTDMPMTPEEKTELANMVANSVSAAIKPVSDAVTAQGAQIASITTTLEANAKAAEAGKRAEVAKQYGEVVANALSGAALDEMHAKLSTAPAAAAATLAANSGAKTGTDAPNFDGLPD